MGERHQPEGAPLVDGVARCFEQPRRALAVGLDEVGRLRLETAAAGGPPATEVITELYVPRPELAAFMAEAAADQAVAVCAALLSRARTR